MRSVASRRTKVNVDDQSDVNALSKILADAAVGAVYELLTWEAEGTAMPRL